MKLKKWDSYRVKFYDHCLGKDSEITCEILGYFVRETKNAYVFTHWVVTNDEDYKEDNIEITTILKSTIIKCVKT